jgi:hypothetical protein
LGWPHPAQGFGDVYLCRRRPDGNEARFAAKLASLLKSIKLRLRLKIVASGDNAKALAQFDRREADLAGLRTDAKIPPRGQSRSWSTTWCCCSVRAARRSNRSPS